MNKVYRGGRQSSSTQPQHNARFELSSNVQQRNLCEYSTCYNHHLDTCNDTGLVGVEKHVLKKLVNGSPITPSAIQYANYDKAVIVTGGGDFAASLNFWRIKAKLLHILTPNHKYSQPLKPFAQYIVHMSQLKKSVEYKKTGIGGRSKP